MDRTLFDDTILAYKRRKPFRPFTIALLDGEQVEVDHPEALLVRDGIALHLGPNRVPSIFDHEGVTRIIGDLANRSGEAANEPA